MALKTRPFDPAEFLDEDESIEAYLQESLAIALEDSNLSVLTQALGAVARARGMSQIAQASGLSRESLYKSLSAEGNPEFGTVLRVMQAMGLKLTIQAA
jgi:probable addiction module antidote protein